MIFREGWGVTPSNLWNAHVLKTQKGHKEWPGIYIYTHIPFTCIFVYRKNTSSGDEIGGTRIWFSSHGLLLTLWTDCPACTKNIQRFDYTSRKKWTQVKGHGSSQLVTSHKSLVTPIYLQKTEKTSLNKLKDQKKKIGAFLLFPLLDLFPAKMESYFTNHTISLEKIQEEFPSKNSLPFGGPGPVIPPFLPKNPGVQWKLWDASYSSYLSNIAIFHWTMIMGERVIDHFFWMFWCFGWPMIMGSIFLAFRDPFSTYFHDFSGERGGKSFDPHGFCGTSKVFKCSSAALRRIFSSKIRPSKAFSCGSCSGAWLLRQFLPVWRKRWVPSVEVKIT